jgi:hypothetical protein
MKTKYSNPAFDDLLEMFIPNFIRQQPYSYKKDTYVMVSDRKFESTLSSFITHKQQMGFNVIVEYTDVVGTDNHSTISHVLQ